MRASVTLLDDNEDLRIMVERILKTKLGIDIISVSSLEDLIQHSDEVLACELIILDMNLGTATSGLDAYRWLSDQGFNEKVFFLTGYDNSNEMVAEAYGEGIEIYQKPLETNKFLSLVSDALKH
jgi:DNA-binding NtrC family response regulator